MIMVFLFEMSRDILIEITIYDSVLVENKTGGKCMILQRYICPYSCL